MRILFITCGSIGDAVLSTGLLSYLLDRYPHADFTIAAGPAAAPLFEAFPRLERLIVIRKQPRKKHWFALWQAVRGVRWDWVVDLRGSLIGFLLRAGKRSVFCLADPAKTKRDQLGALLKLDPSPAPRLWVGEEARRKADALLPGAPLIVMIPKSNSFFKDWPLERFGQLAHRLLARPRYAGAKVAVMGLESQRAALQPLLDGLPVGQGLDLIGKTDLATACALLQRSALVIGNDSGMLHMAGALGAPLIGLYGPTNDLKYAPRGPQVRIAKVREFAASEREIQDPQIIRQLTVQQVEAQVDSLVNAGF